MTPSQSRSPRSAADSQTYAGEIKLLLPQFGRRSINRPPVESSRKSGVGPITQTLRIASSLIGRSAHSRTPIKKRIVITSYGISAIFPA